MGLIKKLIDTGVTSVKGSIGEQMLETIKCEDMKADGNVLMVKKTTPNGIISNGSTIMVAPGQVAVIYDSGAILDATAEEGIYTFDKSTSPSFFSGQDFVTNFKETLKDMANRFTHDGAPAKEQCVFFINIKEIMGNKFGTATPIPFQDWSHAIPNQMTGSINPLSVSVRCYGKYTFQIADPFQFMRLYAGTGSFVTKDSLVEQMTSEVIGSFQNVLNELGNSVHKAPLYELPSQTDEIKAILDERVFDEPIRKRGVKLVSFIIESVTPDDASKAKIDEYEHNSNAMMQQGRVLDVMETAAGNANGAMNGFMGLGMMNMTTGGMTGGVMSNAFGAQGQQTPTFDPYAQQQPAQAPVEQAPAAPTATCSKCGTPVTGKFCPECGTPVEVAGPKVCSNCGKEVTGKFCAECGTPVSE